jgi:hypothetical protein
MESNIRCNIRPNIEVMCVRRQRRLLHSRLSWFGEELSGGAISDYEPAESKVVTFECYWPETVCL